MIANNNKSMENIVNLCKNRGFVYQGSEIYGGLSNTWDYGPLGVELKNNIKNAWWKKFIQQSSLNVGIDSTILMNNRVWEASGHLDGFLDPLIDCRSCKSRHRADTLIEQFDKNIDINGLSNDQLSNIIKEKNIFCPYCNKSDFTNIRNFNLMFKTFQGVTEESKNELYLRPETAQGIFINFNNIQRTTRKKIPFGIGQIGKSFRNEITPGNFIFRTREFEQMELEFFCEPETHLEWFNYWKDFCYNWLVSLNISQDSIKTRDHLDNELSHYSAATTDIEFLFPFGWGELWGIADRTNFDLKNHSQNSGKELTYFDQQKNIHYLPYIIEPSLGVDRLALALLCDAYDEEIIENSSRIVLRLHPFIAPIKAAVLPLSKKLSEKALILKDSLQKVITVDFDETGSIGKRYRRQDEIGTPVCITFDFQSLEDHTVTVRDRDSMTQKRILIENLEKYILDIIKF